jgi:purine-nucleoside phosphorylase
VSTTSTAGHGAVAARHAADAVRARLGVRQPIAAIVLGSGLGELADRIDNARRVPYAEVPGFHATNVAGHRGELICGSLAGREVLAFAGRFHMYEGHSARVAAFPVRVAHALGARVLFTSNAAGGVRRTLRPGDLMLIQDHINLMFQNPIVGALEPGDQRFPDMSSPYAPRLSDLLKASALAVGVPLVEGVYAGLVGPTYETPAEVRMLERLGADAVGMSTVPETIVGAAIGMEVAGVSLITNPAAGISNAPLDHGEVVSVGRAAAGRFAELVAEFVGRL